MKKIILEILKMSYEAKSEMSIYRLERIANVKSQNQVLLGRDLSEFLEILIQENLVSSNDNNSIYSITQQGLEYLEKNTN